MNRAIWFAALVLLPGVAAAATDHERQERIRSFEENFKRVDTNHDGLLSMAETEKNAPGLALRFAQIDANHDGQLSTQEILGFVQQQRREAAERFRRADKNHDGALSKEEAQALPGVLARYDLMDADHNGELTPAEIGRYVRGQIEKRRRQREAASTQH